MHNSNQDQPDIETSKDDSHFVSNTHGTIKKSPPIDINTWNITKENLNDKNFCQSIIKDNLSQCIPENITQINMRNMLFITDEFVQALLECDFLKKKQGMKFMISGDQLQYFNCIQDIQKIEVCHNNVSLFTKDNQYNLCLKKQVLSLTSLMKYTDESGVVIDKSNDFPIILDGLIKYHQKTISFIDFKNMIDFLTKNVEKLSEKKQKIYKKCGIFARIALTYTSLLNDAEKVRLDTLPEKNQAKQKNLATFFLNCAPQAQLMISDQIYIARANKTGKLKDDTVKMCLDESQCDDKAMEEIAQYSGYLQTVNVIEIGHAEGIADDKQQEVAQFFLEKFKNATIQFGPFSIKKIDITRQQNPFTQVNVKEEQLHELSCNLTKSEAGVKIKNITEKYKGFLQLATVLNGDAKNDKICKELVKKLPNITHYINENGKIKDAHKIRDNFFNKFLMRNTRDKSKLPVIAEDPSTQNTDCTNVWNTQDRREYSSLSRGVKRFTIVRGGNDGYATDVPSGSSGKSSTQSGYESAPEGHKKHRRSIFRKKGSSGGSGVILSQTNSQNQGRRHCYCTGVDDNKGNPSIYVQPDNNTRELQFSPPPSIVSSEKKKNLPVSHDRRDKRHKKPDTQGDFAAQVPTQVGQTVVVGGNKFTGFGMV